MHTINFTIERLTALASEMANYFGKGSDVMEEARCLLSDPLWIAANLCAFSDSHIAKILEEHGVGGCAEMSEQSENNREKAADVLIQKIWNCQSI